MKKLKKNGKQMELESEQNEEHNNNKHDIDFQERNKQKEWIVTKYNK